VFDWEKPPLDVPRALSLCIINHLSVPHVTFVLQMNVDKLKKMAGAVRTGGKGSMRRFLFTCASVLVITMKLSHGMGMSSKICSIASIFMPLQFT